jgi:SSS family solute:Na+ symporter
VFLFGIAANVRNFGVDQSYVQRYLKARSDAEAAKSVWLTALLYVPVAAIFFFIGTGLFVFYADRTELLASVTNPDKVFPHFISTQLPVGAAGLVVAAVFAAAMDSNLNSMATLTYRDLYVRYLRPRSGERESMYVLLGSTCAWGVLSTAVALATSYVSSNVLDVWWQWEGIFSGLVLGLFLLGLMSRRTDSAGAMLAVACGIAVIFWLSFSPAGSPTEIWPEQWDYLRSPFHTQLAIVIGTATILGVGFIAGLLRKPRYE